jgi:hypothetical protein
MTKDEIRTYCLYQHMAEFHRQACHEEEADWGKPCANCRLALRECHFDWWENVKSGIPDGIRFQLVFKKGDQSSGAES